MALEKVIAMVLLVLSFAIPSFAEPVYTEDIGYKYVILENGDINAYEVKEIFKDSKYKGSKSKPIIENYDQRGTDLIAEIVKPDFINAVKEENDITGIGMEETITYQTEVLKDGQIQVRQATRTFDNGVEISKTYHRHVLAPDAKDITQEVDRVKDIAGAVWTQDVKDAYAEKQVELDEETTIEK